MVGNTQLESLWIDENEHEDCAPDCFDIDKLLCDSSFESIANSNHILTDLVIRGIPRSRLERCCLLFCDRNKAKVIRKKILRYYFVGEFDVSPFSNMAISVLPEIMSQIDEDKRSEDKITAIYRLLRYLPELCNVSERAWGYDD